MVIQHNLAAMNANRQLNITSINTRKSSEKLSSGYRINRAADDAAGLAISEKMRRTIRGLAQGTDNLTDGISLCQVADGALNEIHDMLNRLSELAVKGANDTLTSDDRSYIQAEVDQLIDGLDDVFINTSFNENYIFRVPYVPNVTGNPNDMQVFNSSTGTPGGVLIGHKRYTFEELGFNINSDGKFAQNSVSFTLDSGETVDLYTKEGSELNDIHRLYRWSADDTGILINNMPAVSWTDLGIVDGRAAGDYSFNYRGMKISFSAEDNDLKQVKAGINGDGISDVCWETVNPMRSEQNAVTMSYTDTFAITNANKDSVHGDGYSYTLRADEEGMWIHDDLHGTDTDKIAWKDINANSGQYPISDWGRPQDKVDEITLDLDETYTFTVNLSDTDSFDSSISMNIKIMDEASLESVMRGLDGQQFSVKNVAALSGSIDSRSSVSANLSFEFQRENGRDFDAAAGNNAFSDSFAIMQSAGALVHHDVEGTEGYDSFDGKISLEINGKVFSSSRLYADSRSSDHLSNVRLYFEGDANEYLTIDKYYFQDGDQEIELKAASSRPSQTLKANSAYSADAETMFGVKVNPPEKKMIIQASSEVENYIELKWSPLNTGILGIGGLLYTSSDASRDSIEAVKAAQQIVSEERSTFGAYQNRLEHSVRNNMNIEENTQSAESIIRDTNMAEEMQKYSNSNIIAQAGQTMLAQANQSKQGVLSLLQ